MRLFKYCIVTILVIITVGYASNNQISKRINVYDKSVENLYVANKNSICTNDDYQNYQTIAKNESLTYYFGETVIDQVSSNFSNPLIPSTYQISSDDLEQAHALADGENMVLTTLNFSDVDKFNKVSEFFKLGQLAIGYELKIDEELNLIMISFDFNDLDYYSKLYYNQKCY